MASTAAALRKPPSPAVSAGYSTVPDSYFDHLPKCLSPTAYVVVGQILRRTRWGDPVRLNRPEWARLSIEDMAQRLAVDEKTVRRAFAEAETAGCIESRRSGQHLEYCAKVEAFTRARVREWEPKPAKTKAAPAAEPLRLPVAIACPKGLECPVEELVERQDGTFCNELQPGATGCNGRKKGEEQRTIMSGVVNIGDRTIMSGVPKSTPLSSPRAALRSLVEARFVERLGTAPPDGLLDQVLTELRGASLEQYAHALDAHQAKVKAWGILPHLAKDCARGRAVWEAGRVEARPGCKRCGAGGETVLLVDGLCSACRDSEWYRREGAGTEA
jgi:hypothetical protein